MKLLSHNLLICACAVLGIFQIVSGDDAEDVKLVNTNYCEKDNHKHLHSSNFTHYRSISLDPSDSFFIPPNWVIYEKGSSAIQTVNSDPGLIANYHFFKGVDFEGSVFVDTDIDDDFFGFVFSLQDSKSFYVVTWKKSKQTFWNTSPKRAVSEAGVHIKLVNSKTGPGPALRNALWNTEDTENEVKLLWNDPNKTGWQSKTAYEWKIIHRPSIGLINVRIFKSKEPIIQATVFDSTLQGGRVGLFDFSQEMVVWSNMKYRCIENIPKGLHSTLTPELQAKIGVEQ